VTTQVLRISNSEISTFKDCRRKWWLSYYRQLGRKEQKFSGPLALGSRVHKALELYYNDNSKNLLTYWSELVADDRITLEAEWRDTTDFDNEADLGRIMLEGYLEWNSEEGIDSELEVVSNEERLTTTLLDGRVELMAKIDQHVWTRLHGELSDMVAVRDALDSGVDHQLVVYPRPSRDCSWKCDFAAVCPMFDDGSAVEAAIEMGYQKREPYDYYGDGTKSVEVV
jgi:hypothetical protein